MTIHPYYWQYLAGPLSFRAPSCCDRIAWRLRLSSYQPWPIRSTTFETWQRVPHCTPSFSKELPSFRGFDSSDCEDLQTAMASANLTNTDDVAVCWDSLLWGTSFQFVQAPLEALRTPFQSLSNLPVPASIGVSTYPFTTLAHACYALQSLQC